MASTTPNKLRSETGKSRSATPASGKPGVTPENRKTRRKRTKEAKELDNGLSPSNGIENAEAGPSKSPSQIEPGFGDEDFIAFEPSDTEDEKPSKDVEVVEAKTSGNSGEKGKGRAREYEHAGRKRKSDEIDFNDGYANKKERMDANSRRAPWAADVDWENCHNVAEMLHREVDAFVKYISPSPVEDEVRSLIVRSISNAVTKDYPDAKVLPFGSYQTKLYLPLGDIDLVIESQSMAYSSTAAVLQSLANTMKRAGITDKVTIIGKAKVPIIKFITRHGRFSVDISINQTNGVKTGSMINRFLKELPALRGLVLVTKAFLSQRSMNEVYTGGLGSYSIVCLAISFLQHHPKIRRGEIDPSKNLGVLMMDFFDLYGNYFRYDEVGISVRDGGSYYKKQQRGWSDYRAPGLLSIEDPGDPSNDISRGSFAIARVRTTLAGAFSILTSTAYQREEYISSRRERRYYPLQSRTDQESMSILATVMGITQETINHRRVVQEVYDNRVLHRMAGIKPLASVHSSKEPSSNDEHKTEGRSRNASDIVSTAWAAEDMNLESGDEQERRISREEEEEESRYDIRDKKLPPKKRRRIGTEKDMHTVYTSDEDEDEGLSTGGGRERLIVHADMGQSSEGSEADGVEADEAEYATGRDDELEKAKRS
ncbi:hypothetical protein BDY19DRAFT_918831 [Irpex rosettiformis]|uniref:Uncharacterized protein n=1 Tax=Irpex rosettiformis TaxID=378272 RepID=A0ACB8UHJ9_9APHY|nr:hypothetical protein BDY19DRAFT_918831 [Irpex rosettiformis]